MRPDILIPIFLSIPVSLLFYTVLTRGVDGHLRRFREKLRFFFWPFPPDRMLVVQELDGEYKVLYDEDYEEVQTGDMTLIRTRYGDSYVTEVPPSQSAIVTSLFEARGPPGYPSPFSIAWRWVVSASILVYMVYYSLVVSVIPSIEIREVTVGLQVLSLASIRPIDPWEVMVSVTCFFVSLTWLLVNVQRMNDRTISMAWYHAKGINPPHVAIVPSPTLSTLSLLEYLGKLGRSIVINVPGDLKDILTVVGERVGSKSLAAVILAKLSMMKAWREALAEVLREQFTLMKAGETQAALRLGFHVTRKMVPIAVIVFIVGFVLGFLVGNVYTVTVTPVSVPPVTQTTTPPLNQTTTVVTPPTMPPPPVG